MSLKLYVVNDLIPSSKRQFVSIKGLFTYSDDSIEPFSRDPLNLNPGEVMEPPITAGRAECVPRIDLELVVETPGVTGGTIQIGFLIKNPKCKDVISLRWGGSARVDDPEVIVEEKQGTSGNNP